MNSLNDGLDARAHALTLQLLAEAADYLGRLPVNPATYAMGQKIRLHLNDPAQVARALRLEEVATSRARLALVESGVALAGVTRLCDSGAPVIACQLLYPELRIESPALRDFAAEGADVEPLVDEIVEALSGGLTITMGLDLFR